MTWFHRERDLRDELESHRRLAAQDGAAEREFGNYDLVAETTRDQWAWHWLSGVGRDLRLAARDLRHHRSYAAVAIITFGLAMAAFASIYGMLDALYYHPLPYVPHAARLGVVEPAGPGRSFGQGLAPAEFQAIESVIRRRGTPFAAVAATTFGTVVRTGGLPLQLNAGYASPGYFSKVLGTVPHWGRAFAAGDYQPGSATVILSGRFARAQLGGVSALGKVVHLDGRPYTVVGILGRQFDVPAGVDIWLPLRFTPLEWSTTWRQLQGQLNSGRLELAVWSRLRPGATWAEANAELAALSRTLPEGGEAAPRLRADPVNRVLNGNLLPLFAGSLLAAMGFLLLLACANVANLNLARASARRHELALRAALGAGRARLAQLVLAESILLAFLGGLVGVALCAPMLHLLGTGAPPGFSAAVTGYDRIGLNYHVLLAAFAICTAVGVLSGLVPAWQVVRRRGGAGALHAASDRCTVEAGLTLPWLIGVQTALALVLLAGTALMLTGFAHFATGIRRFQPQGIVTFGLNLPPARYASAAQRVLLYHTLLGRLRSLPGVESAAALSTIPYSNDGANWIRYAVSSAPGVGRRAIEQDISPGFFAVLHVALLRGRDFTQGDIATAPPVAIVSQNLARARWPRGDALGQRLRTGPNGPWLRVVGVAAEAEYAWTDETVEPAIFRPLAQAAPAQSLIAVRSRAASVSVAAAIRRRAAQLDPQLPLLSLQTLHDDLAFALAPVYTLGYMMAALGLIALALTLAGLYGVTAYSAQRRLRELGVRAACGAKPRQLIGLVLRRSLRAVAVGLGFGVVGGVLFQHAAASFFFGVQPGEFRPLAAAAALLLVTALGASYLPARRAASSDPMRVLRED